jgi:multicomponent Na+:H+ antiporter subunit B
MASENKKGMTIIVKTITRLTVGFILLYGIYIISHGHVSPGGGFAGGVIIALSLVHLMLAYGKEETLRRLSRNAASVLESTGALIFLLIAVLGFTGGIFFLNFIPKGEPFTLFSAGIIPLCNIAISFKVSGGLFAIFVALALLRFDTEKKK